MAALAEQAARLCKADLVSATVGEFPEVQGLAGAYLARDVDGTNPGAGYVRVALVGVSDLIVVASGNDVLVLPRGRSQEVKKIIDALKDGDRVELRGFGAFSAKGRNARMGRNPRTGEAVEVIAKRVPFFKTGKELRERLNLPKA